MSADSSCFSGMLLWTRQWPYVSIQGAEFLDWASVSQELKDSVPCSQMDGVYRAWSEDVTAAMSTVKFTGRLNVKVEFLCATNHYGEDAQKYGY